jgi:GNAT superfamily N-acetyltransferase
MPPDIVSVSGPALIKEFVEFPYSLYAGHPHWVPPLRRDEYRRLTPKHNPFFEHGEIEMWLARDGGRVTGRIAAIHDRLHDATHHERATWFGFFEARDQATASVLLRTVEDRAKARGSAVVRGPANPSLNESAGLLIDCFDEDPSILMPYNGPEYPGYVEAEGYRKAKDLLAWDIPVGPAPERIARVAERVSRRHGITVRPANLREYKRDLALMIGIYKAAWVDNWGFVPPTDAEITQLANDLRPIIDPEIVLFAEQNGRAVACSVALPNVNQVLKRMGGNLLPFGIVHFLRRKSIINELRLLILGVLPEARKVGLYPLLIAENHRRAHAAGYRRAELSWTLEDNDDINAGIEATGGRRNKTYRLYEKRVAQ